MQRLINYNEAVKLINNYTDIDFRNELLSLMDKNISKISDRDMLNFSLFNASNNKEVTFCNYKFISLLLEQCKNDIVNSYIGINFKFKTELNSLFSMILIPNKNTFWIMVKKKK